MCERCDAIRMQASLIMSLTFSDQPVMNVMQTLASMYSILKHAAIQAGEEEMFSKVWDMMIDEEFKVIIFDNPIEPIKFDDKFDVRDHLKKTK